MALGARGSDECLGAQGGWIRRHDESRRVHITNAYDRERDRRNCERVGRELFHQKSIHSPNTQVLLSDALILGKPGELGKLAWLRLKGLWLLAKIGRAH